MKRIARWKWVLFSPLLYGCLVGVSCTQLAKEAALNGTIEFLLGATQQIYVLLVPGAASQF